jgi:hypothetical protein
MESRANDPVSLPEEEAERTAKFLVSCGIPEDAVILVRDQDDPVPRPSRFRRQRSAPGRWRLLVRPEVVDEVAELLRPFGTPARSGPRSPANRRHR